MVDETGRDPRTYVHLKVKGFRKSQYMQSRRLVRSVKMMMNMESPPSARVVRLVCTCACAQSGEILLPVEFVVGGGTL
jgi:hypothetical protein